MRDFSTISPSAKTVILMKGHTTIPWAREAAELVSFPDPFVPDFSQKDLLFWSKVVHFEGRYQGINQLLDGLEVDGFLELSSGFNFRCLEVAGKTGKKYIDTDLPDLIEKKRDMLDRLAPENGGLCVLRPLNVLDEGQFRQVVAELPPGTVAIVNEGLLMYFDRSEKEALCAIIRRVLQDRGGYWITSDIYVRATPVEGLVRQDKEGKSFTERHNVEANKFGSFEEAREFFEANGFAVDQEETLDPTQLSSFPHLWDALPAAVREGTPRGPNLRTTWRLRVV